MSASIARLPATWPSWIAPALTLLLLCVVLLVVHRELEHFHLHEMLGYLRGIPASHLVAAAICTVVSYALLGLFDLTGLRYLGKRLPYPRVALSSFIAYAIANNAGASALTGTAMRLRLYTPQGLTGTEIVTLQGYCSLTTALGLGTLTALSLLFAHDRSVAMFHLLGAWTWVCGLLLFGAIAAYVGWGSMATRGIGFRGWSLRPPGPVLAPLQVVLASLELSMDCAVLWLLLPPDAHIGLPGFIGVFALAVAAGIISHVPGGLGVFESVVLLAVPNVPRNELLGALLAYRAIYYVAPLIVAGALFAVVELYGYRHRVERVSSLVSAYVAQVSPQIAGTLVLLAGIVLLISGATPATASRLVILRSLLPLPVLEMSHLIGSISGLGLLVLARALYRRVREAYRVAVALLIAGIVVSLLKGLDYEEAAILAIALAVLYLGRDAFHRPASLMEERFTPMWIVGIAAVLGAVAWVGYFAHRHVQYSSELWWTFAFSADAPRTLRALLITVLTAATFFAMNLLRPARPPPVAPSSKELERARAIIDRSDETLANAALCADKRLLFAPNDEAFIMYQVARRSWVALGDPVGAPEHYEELVWRFTELTHRYGGWTVFYQAGPDHLPLYIDCGLSPVKIGEEARVSLSEFSLSGSERRDIRQSHAHAARDDATFEVVPVESVPALLPELHAISDAWLQEKSAGEKGFSIGRFDETYIRQFPVAVVRRGETPVAFANLWTTRSRAELSVDLMRFGAGAPHGVMDFLFAELMSWGRAQGYRWFNLGMAPLAGLDQGSFTPAWHRIGSFVFRHGEHFYNFEGLRSYKAKFAPVWIARYLAAPPGILVLPGVLADISTLIAGGLKELVKK
ncbi:bifunctional lysylphosphatidylglycerol flippase/synthetase MprF [Peristeroidobacter soli]|uniref:bifunctional lysylphosphatidylglycerol flippase/synthetase MprF n=1 Tax=Peristeroidobacter soli TaxID=2497877 RepID=UPI00130038F1|nr:bifunctional lysylphosphatidylglycerol flippase/synthetase MprF [Peristeroidobacter soli]